MSYMESQNVSRDNLHGTDQWQSLVGEAVEVRRDGEVYRTGLVDAAMPDASGLWIASEAAYQREFIDAASGFEVWTGLYPRSSRDGVPRPSS
ncbi:hypothetical protein J2S94_004212 [Arthrobacter bambusae]|nr:hypothetical protein [Arthrobacter bambusae]